MTTTAKDYADRVEQRGQRIDDAPQPYGASVAELIKAGRLDDIPYLLAHALHDLDVALGKA